MFKKLPPALSRSLKYRMNYRDPREFRKVLLLLWAVFIFGSCVLAGIRFASGVSFEGAFGHLWGSLFGFTLGIVALIVINHFTHSRKD